MKQMVVILSVSDDSTSHDVVRRLHRDGYLVDGIQVIRPINSICFCSVCDEYDDGIPGVHDGTHYDEYCS